MTNNVINLSLSISHNSIEALCMTVIMVVLLIGFGAAALRKTK